jgi:hypothetical protein
MDGFYPPSAKWQTPNVFGLLVAAAILAAIEPGVRPAEETIALTGNPGMSWFQPATIKSCRSVCDPLIDKKYRVRCGAIRREIHPVE